MHGLSRLLQLFSQCRPVEYALRFVSKELLLKIINVILRVPSLFITEIWMRTDPNTLSFPLLDHNNYGNTVDKALQSAGTNEYVVIGLYYAAIALAVALAFLPLKKLVQLYMYLLSIALLLAAHHCSGLYVSEEKLSAEKKNAALQASLSVLEDSDSLRRAGVHAVIQVAINVFIGYLLNLSNWKLPFVSIYIIPVLARVANYPVQHLHLVYNFAFLYEMINVVISLFHIIPKILDNIWLYAQKIWLAIQLYGWMPFLIAIWFRVTLPLQLLTFWTILFSVQIYKYAVLHEPFETIESFIFMILTCMANCCVTSISLLGLCMTISYLAFAVLTATRVFLLGRTALLEAGSMVQRGYTEGFTMFLLALQTGLLEMKTTQRAFLMCIVLFIVVSSLVQSVFEITDPILLSLGAAQSRNVGKHMRTVFLSTLLFVVSLYMPWIISRFFDIEFWLMVVISNCVLTAIQVLGSMITYALFMYDAFCDGNLESLDDFVYYAKASTRSLEFILAVFVVCYGVRESMVGDWNWVNAIILIVHCYFNVWQRLQVGWKSYLLRREASKKVETMCDASAEELRVLNDVCCICYQPMSNAKVTKCNHYFHVICVRKWLYVQEKCPMCHAEIHYVEPVHTSNDA